MATNSLYPGFTKMYYGTGGNLHTMILPMIPDGTPNIGIDPSILTRAGTPNLWSTYMTSLINLIKPLYNTATDFTLAEFYYMEEIDSDPQFVHGINPALSGTSATANTSMAQQVLTFRTYEGGIWKLFLMEAVITVNVVTSWPFAVGAVKTLADHLISTGSAVVGRDGGYPLVPLRSITKTNDALRKRVLLNT